ncbi:hypothetical protein EUTSA_v10012103mg, partial [Eutrema salsugineum]
IWALALMSMLTQHYYLPLAGHVKWNPQDPKPCIVVLPYDTVSLIVAESSDADFSSVSRKGLRPAKEICSLVPELPVSGDSPQLLSLQVTLFPNQGFSIGIVSHHVFMDAITAQMFIKSWAHICKHGAKALPEDLTPFLDRTVIYVPDGLEEKMLEFLLYLSEDKDNGRTLKLPLTEETDADVYRVTLELTLENVEKLKERAKNGSNRPHLELHLPTFVIVNAYLWTCLVKARGGETGYVPRTYSGVCVFAISCLGYKAKSFLGEDGFINVDRMKNIERGTQVWGVSGSKRFSVYESDFGWGRPVNSEIVSIDQCQLLSMSEMRDETGGVEIGLCLKKSEMDVFIYLFKKGFENYFFLMASYSRL